MCFWKRKISFQIANQAKLAPSFLKKHTYQKDRWKTMHKQEEKRPLIPALIWIKSTISANEFSNKKPGIDKLLSQLLPLNTLAPLLS